MNSKSVYKMYTKIQQIYRQPENKAYFVDNEYVYTESMKQIFGIYEDGAESANFFGTVLTHIDELFGKNAKAYSQLKHLSYELATMLSNTGNLIHKISNLYNESIKAEEQAYEKIKFKVSPDVDNVNKKLHVGLTEWGSQMLTQSRYVIDNIAGFFHYKKHENSTFSKLVTSKIGINNSQIKANEALDSKKQKLFGSKNTEKWRINFDQLPGDFNEMSKDFHTIKHYMLPDVSLQGNKAIEGVR